MDENESDVIESESWGNGGIESVFWGMESIS